jgi:hypothetical protein
MLRIICPITFVLISLTVFSQKPKTVTANTQKPAAPKPITPKLLKDLRDSASYTAGIHIVNKYRPQNIYNFNGAVVAKACNDLQSNNPPLINNSDADNAVLAYQTQLMADPKKTVKPPVAGVILNDMRDSASYAAGIYLINFFREFDITNFNPAIITIAINDLQSQKKPLMNDSLANMVAMRYQSKLQEIKNKPTIDAGKKFLAENKKRPGVKVTPSGLQYEVITGRNREKANKTRQSIL